MAFKDTQGKTWDLAVTIGGVKRVKRTLDVDLFEVVALTEAKTSLMSRLTTDHALLVDVCFVLLMPQLEAEHINDEQFAERLGGEAFAQMRATLFAEMRRFFQESGRAEQVLSMDKILRTEQLAMAAMVEEIGAVDPEAHVSAARAAGKLSSNGQASSASTPTT